MTLQEQQIRQEFKKKLEALEETIRQIRQEAPKGMLPLSGTVWQYSQDLWNHGNAFRDLLMKN